MKKAQVWSLDIIVGVTIFIIAIIIFYIYTINLSDEAESSSDDLNIDADFISSNILSEGSPRNWNKTNVLIPGIVTDNKINETKLVALAQLSKDNYDKSRQLLGTKYDYFVFLENKDGLVYFGKNQCGIGSAKATEQNISIFKVAYYIGKEKQILNLTIGVNFTVDIYCEKNNNYENGSEACNSNVKGKTQYLNNVSKYNLTILEDVHFDESDFAILNLYVLNGGKVFISEHFNFDYAFGIKYIAGNNPNPVRIVAQDIYNVLNLTIGADYDIKDGPTVNNTSTVPGAENVSDYVVIGRYNSGTGAGGIVRWNYGQGHVYFFGDFAPVNIAQPVWKKDVVNSITNLLTIECRLNIKNIKAKNLIKNERFVFFRNKPAKMTFYVWDNP
ncbi:hypothetical protein HYV49_05035 [Candidatus Pacearchaeota archaeon]|nr:hypothetical protein [Candidatus Pacearchaeota archaeon]